MVDRVPKNRSWLSIFSCIPSVEGSESRVPDYSNRTIGSFLFWYPKLEFQNGSPKLEFRSRIEFDPNGKYGVANAKLESWLPAATYNSSTMYPLIFPPEYIAIV